MIGTICVFGRPQQHCGSATWWVMVCMRVVSRSDSFHLVPTVPDPRRGCLHRFLELPDGGLSDAWFNTDCIQELHSSLSNKTAAVNLHWVYMAFPAIVLWVPQVVVLCGFPLMGPLNANLPRHCELSKYY